MTPRRTALLLGAALLLAMVGGIAFGPADLAPADIRRALAGDPVDPVVRAIVWDLRLPRVVLAALLGAALGMSGAVMQATLRNPLADPYLLGVSGGAAVGAVLAVAAGVQAPAMIAAAAFAGAMVAVGVGLALARAAAPLGDPRILLMAGVVTGAFANAAIMVVMATAAPDVTRNALWWMMGSVASARWPDAALLAAAVAAGGGALLHQARTLDVLALGEEAAAGLGVAPGRAAARVLACATLLSAASVAVAGLVGFVGLLVPHLARALTGGRARATLAAAAVAGAALVVVADVVARVARAPAELPLGAVTALLGVPFFLSRLRRSA